MRETFCKIKAAKATGLDNGYHGMYNENKTIQINKIKVLEKFSEILIYIYICTYMFHVSPISFR